MQVLKILVSRHSAFYSPLIATLAADFLRNEGLDATYGVLRPGQTSREALLTGEAHIVQSAVSSNWAPLEKGIAPLPVHFAQINCRDGFFLTAREPHHNFQWTQLAGKTILADHGAQPLAMLKYAAHVNGLDWSTVQSIDAGAPEAMEAAFRTGTADYIHLQGPAPQRLAHEGLGHIVASVGAAMPECAFSSLTAMPEFLTTDAASAFERAFHQARLWVQETLAEQIAATEQSFFPGIESNPLAQAIEAYQRIGCWRGSPFISREHYEQSLNVFEHSKLIRQRHPYEAIVWPAPQP